tara:strand:- start:1495 stop:1830 length:336 start_codon:yes stop_codon:yes gene_type:complete
MNIVIKFAILIASGLVLGGCSMTEEDVYEDNKVKTETSSPKPVKQIKNLFIPIGGFTSGFIYCGFDGDKSFLDDFIAEGWVVQSITPQNFQTSKRNGEIVLCNGNSYLLER